MSKTATYALIASNTVSGSAAASVTFSSIPATYTDLVLVIAPIVTAATTFGMQYNGATTGTPYSTTIFYGNGTSALAARTTNENVIRISYGATSRTTNSGNIIVNILDYANATTFKTNLSRDNIAGEGVGAQVSLWRSTAAINQIVISPNSGGTIIAVGSTFKLYGIQAGNA